MAEVKNFKSSFFSLSLSFSSLLIVRIGRSAFDLGWMKVTYSLSLFWLSISFKLCPRYKKSMCGIYI